MPFAPNLLHLQAARGATAWIRGLMVKNAISPIFAVGLVGGLLVACGSSSDAGEHGAASAVSAADETCTATFHWLQKDAYKNTGGRTSALWPPHTTTMIDVVCKDASGNQTYTTSAFKENHGTKPGDLDASGRAYLDDVKQATATGSRASVQGLLDAYAGCACDATTQFLGMDSVKEDLTVQNIVAKFADYAALHLTCSGDKTTEDVVGMMKAGDIEGVLAAYPGCAWQSGYGALDGLEQAAGTLFPDLSKYHVCNNDAELEAQLFQTFAKNGTAPACDSTSKLCSGPTFFYSP